MTTGIGDIAVYIPKLIMRLSRLLERYALSNPTIQRILDRAIHKTGQISVRFPHFWEDAVTMAAQAAMQVLSRMSDSAVASLRYIAVGTESATDLAKPIAAHVGGMLRAAGFPIANSIATFQTQHACAGGTYSLLGVNALLSLSPIRDERGLVICTDVARYAPGTSAEITQGAGAVAMIAERGCGLVELDVASTGYASRDVDDFFRPVGAFTPRVRGSFSIHCYKETIEDAFLDHCQRTAKTPAEVLRETDLFAFHAPYHHLPLEMMGSLVAKYLGLSGPGDQPLPRRARLRRVDSPRRHRRQPVLGVGVPEPRLPAQPALPAARRTHGRRAFADAVLRIGQHRGGTERAGGGTGAGSDPPLGHGVRARSRAGGAVGRLRPLGGRRR